MRVHDALRKAFTKFNAYADPFTLMELEGFVLSALKEGEPGQAQRTLIDNVRDVLARSDDPDPEGRAKAIVEYILQLCSRGCTS
ncbi:MAG: hypothetical protein RXP86_05290 [Acidilobus sp.]|nr:hypothetical protein [Acidilobus sp.]